MNLLTFHNFVKDVAKRGTTLDDIIPLRTKQAVQWLEKNYTYKYMERFAKVKLQPSAEFPEFVDVPSQRVKRYNFIRYLGSEVDDPYVYLPQKDPEEFISLTKGAPTSYLLSGVEFIVLDATPTEELVLETSFIEYSSWGSEDSYTHWLLQNASDLLLAQTMLMLSPIMKDEKLKQLWKLERDEALRVLFLADEHFRQGSRSESMKMVVGYDKTY